MSSFIKELTNPKTGKKQKAFCIDDFYGKHQYGYGFLKDGKDANFEKFVDSFNFRVSCDFYNEEEINKYNYL